MKKPMIETLYASSENSCKMLKFNHIYHVLKDLELFQTIFLPEISRSGNFDQRVL